MAYARCFPFALLALACTPRANIGGNFPPVDAGADVVTAPVDVVTAPTDVVTPPVDVVAPPADIVAPPTDSPVTPRVDACISSGAEVTRESCVDGRDNDCDGFSDCTDPGCAAFCVVDAGCVPSAENANATCSDGRDNDCDGFTDCNDFSCSTSTSVTICPRDAGPVCVPTAEDSNLACSDGRDNDCDGFLDCNDFSCSTNPSVTICPRDAGTTSRDAVYRDTQRFDAAGCVRTGDENNLTVCNDGVDNDCDGYLDCDDRNCSCIGACPAALLGCTCRGVETNNSLCRNGIDDDCNGFVDCNDFGCSRNPSVNVCLDGGL